jgi:hypothetical protein
MAKEKSALEKIVKLTFCDDKKIAGSIVGCGYIQQTWCEKKCKYAQNLNNYQKQNGNL